ncbi:hypothetical protein B4U80_04075 [Leptotrombidium deliense]|uniref:tRNA (34-2'-O)-methyltransferase regulator WDR6 n=1 Tax=Leptotrombidium deliense TaxID=299467 RepID=A0A443SQR0_9ACAR|nr:hypothetical protein B4U80_04075 [Leptotrombidium deliense]
MSLLQSQFIKTSITCIHVNSRHLFVGFGNILQIWSLDDLKVLSETTVFENCKVHCISSSFCEHLKAITAVVAGNRLFQTFKVYDSTVTKLGKAINISDWILETKINNCRVFCVVANNSLIVCDIHNESELLRIQCPTKCILYSALLLEIGINDRVLLAAGTVFKEVIIWENEDCAKVTIVQRIAGHDGVIFSINYNHSNKLLATASDDRSIRLYRHCIPNNVNDEKQFAINGEIGQFNFLNVFYGHESRIWKVIVLQKYILSVGENSNIHLWNIEDEKLMFKETKYSDSDIWTVCVDESSQRIFYGGNDCCVRVKHIEDMIRPTIISSLKCDSHVPKSVGFHNGSLMVISDNGIFSVYDCLNEKPKISINLGKRFQNYCIFSTDILQKFILFGNNFGEILKVNFNNLSKESFEAHCSKVFSLFFVSVDIYLTCGLNGEMKLWNESKLIRRHTLPVCKYRWPTCGLMLFNLLIVGDRSGSVTAFKPNEESRLFNSIHGSNGVTDIQSNSLNFVYSCGRNGKVVQYFYNEVEDIIYILRVISFGSSIDWISKLYFDSNGSIHALGFVSTDFVVISEEQQSTLWTVSCGGGHRSWDFRRCNDTYHFSFIKQKEIFWYSKRTNSVNNPLSVPSNSSKINCASFLFQRDVSDFYFVTAGESSEAVIFRFNVKSNELHKEASLCGHISNIKATASINSREHTLLVTAGGRSQLIIWKLIFLKGTLVAKQLVNHFLWNLDGPKRKPWKNFAPTVDPQTRYMSVTIDECESDMFLIGTACSDSFFRLFLFNYNDNLFEMIGICEAGNFCGFSLKACNQIYVYGSNDGKLRFWSHDKNIVTQICSKLHSVEKSTKDLEVLNGLFSKTLSISPLSYLNSHLQHQSAVNSFDCRHIIDNFWILCSGGDDTSLVCTLLKFTSNSVEVLFSTVKHGFHCSSLTGVLILSTDLLLTTSVDEKVILWKYVVDLRSQSIDVNPAEMNSSCVADISGCTHTFTK